INMGEISVNSAPRCFVLVPKWSDFPLAVGQSRRKFSDEVRSLLRATWMIDIDIGNVPAPEKRWRSRSIDAGARSVVLGLLPISEVSEWDNYDVVWILR
ncbi:MAG TPA: hypothetical protein VM163_01795, partial [bacterium]|nr:hypothetical protein [bacterium]